MSNILGKLTFHFLIGQLLPGLFLLTAGLCIGDLWTASSPVTPASVVSTYSAVLGHLTGAAPLLTALAGGAAVGFVLQGMSSAAEANLESFRTFLVNGDGKDIKLEAHDIRRRSVFRKKLVGIWVNGRMGVILLIGPALAMFDVASVAVATPRQVYKDLHVFRATIPETSTASLADYLYLQAYFANATIALLVILVVHLVLVFSYESAIAGIAISLGIYLAVGLHYLLWRTTKASLDHALVPSLAPRKHQRLHESQEEVPGLSSVT